MKKAAVRNEEIRTPAIGDTVMITYRTDGEGKIIAIQDTDTISRLYLDGTVSIGNDLYTVAPHNQGGVKWKTVRPGRIHDVA